MPTITFNPPQQRTETSGGASNIVWDGNAWTQVADDSEMLSPTLGAADEQADPQDS